MKRQGVIAATIYAQVRRRQGGVMTWFLGSLPPRPLRLNLPTRRVGASGDMKGVVGVVKIPSDFIPTESDLFAHRVDMRFSEDVHLLGECGRQLFARTIASAQRNEIPERSLVFPLLLNGLMTATAALELWRRGFLLQVGILLRNAMESVATAAAISSDKAAAEQYRLGRYNSSKAFSEAKKASPVIGMLARATGVLSKEFVHIGEGYRTWLGTSSELTDGVIGNLRTMLLPLKVTFQAIDMLSEMVCWEMVSGPPRYWEKTGPNAYTFLLSYDGREWMGRFFREDLPRVTGPPDLI